MGGLSDIGRWYYSERVISMHVDLGVLRISVEGYIVVYDKSVMTTVMMSYAFNSAMTATHGVF